MEDERFGPLKLSHSERVMYEKAEKTLQSNTKLYSNERRMATYVMMCLEHISRLRKAECPACKDRRVID